MARGNGSVVCPVYLPAELKMIAERYQERRMLTSFSATIKELLETHPAIAELISEVYATASQTERK